jgi:hypothetical protein
VRIDSGEMKQIDGQTLLLSGNLQGQRKMKCELLMSSDITLLQWNEK